jgi:hypothetical protein
MSPSAEVPERNVCHGNPPTTEFIDYKIVISMLAGANGESLVSVYLTL